MAHSVIVALALVNVARSAQADVDITGTWNLVAPMFQIQVAIQQTGSALTVDFFSPPAGSGSINPMSGAFTFSRSEQCGISTWNGTAAPDSNSMSGTGTLEVFFQEFGCVTIPFTFTGSRVLSCGNGVLDPGEACDDHNHLNGDCCSATCSFEAAGAICANTAPCMVGRCDGAGACILGPRDCADPSACTIDSCDPVAGCVHPPDIRACRAAGKTKLLLKPGAAAALKWKWVKGQSTSPTEFGDPTATATYTFCLFAGSTAAEIASFADVPPDAQRWSKAGDRGFTFKDTTGTWFGVQRILLRSSDANRAKIGLKAKGPNVPIDIPPQFDSLTAQLMNSDTNVCWGATYDAADVMVTNGKLKARSSAP